MACSVKKKIVLWDVEDLRYDKGFEGMFSEHYLLA